MEYAVVVNVEFPTEAHPVEYEQMLNEGAIPAAKGQPGFQTGMWLRDTSVRPRPIQPVSGFRVWMSPALKSFVKVTLRA